MNQKSLEDILPPDLLKEMDAVAAAEGRDVAGVVGAAVRRYLWDSTFRTLRRHAQVRGRVQGVVSDEAVLTTVLATRRPDEFSVPKPTDLVVADVDEDVEEAEAPMAPSGRAMPREREREERRPGRSAAAGPVAERAPRTPRERPPVEEGGARRGRRRGSGRGADGRSPDAGVDRGSPSPGPYPTSAPAAAPTVDLAGIRRRAEIVHRFLPPDLEIEADTPPVRESAPRFTPRPLEEESSTPPWKPSLESPVSEADSPTWPPVSQEKPRTSPPPFAEQPLSAAPAAAVEAPTAVISYGRKPKRVVRRG